MAEEKLFIIPLRRKVIKKPKYQRTKKAITITREFIQKHMKVNKVKIGPYLNKKIWERGNKYPPNKIKVKSIIEENIALVELPEFEFQKKKEKEKETLKEKILGKKEKPEEKIIEAKAEEIKEEEKLVKEHKVEEKHITKEQKLIEKHPAEYKGEMKEEVSKGKLKYKETYPAKDRAKRFLKHKKEAKE